MKNIRLESKQILFIQNVQVAKYQPIDFKHWNNCTLFLNNKVYQQVKPLFPQLKYLHISLQHWSEDKFRTTILKNFMKHFKILLKILNPDFMKRNPYPMKWPYFRAHSQYKSKLYFYNKSCKNQQQKL